MENVKSCSLAELENMEQETYQLLDIRSMEAFDHGHLKDALNIPANELIERKDELQTEKKIIVYCQSGVISTDQAELLSGFGFDACSLEGGYDKWLLNHFQETARNADIEKSIRKKFHKSIFSKFTKAINEYQLVREGDKIAVCISGGKDSMLMAKLFQELQRHHKFPFEVVYLVMDPGYNERNRQIIEQNAKILNIPLTIFETNIFEAVYNIEKSPCYLCARMRRGHLYSKAKELGCNKIALGHHFNDVIETTVMAMFYGAQLQAMLPKLHSSNFEGMELIRPMYCIHEEDIIRWKNAHGLEFIQCACRFTENCAASEDGSGNSKRQEVKLLLKRLKKDNPDIEKSVFNSIHSVCLDTMPGWKIKGETHSFLEHYDRE